MWFPAEKFPRINAANLSDAKVLPNMAPTQNLPTPNMAPFVRGARNVSWFSVVLIANQWKGDLCLRNIMYFIQ